MLADLHDILKTYCDWACGAVGSALPWHGRGRRFEPDQVHQNVSNTYRSPARQNLASPLLSSAPWLLRRLGASAVRALWRFCCRRGRRWPSSRPLGRFLGPTGPLGGLALLWRNVGALWRNTGLFGGFGLLSRRGWSGSGFLGRCHGVFSFGGDYRPHIDHSGAPGKQGNSAYRKGRSNSGATELQRA